MNRNHSKNLKDGWLFTKTNTKGANKEQRETSSTN
jgi:hypothetical protein